MAEGTGFEPAVPCGTPVFETGTFDHSDTLPDFFIIAHLPHIRQILSQNLNEQLLTLAQWWQERLGGNCGTRLYPRRDLYSIANKHRHHARPDVDYLAQQKRLATAPPVSFGWSVANGDKRNKYVRLA